MIYSMSVAITPYFSSINFIISSKSPNSHFYRWIGNDKTGGGHYMNIEDLKLVLQNAPHFDFIIQRVEGNGVGIHPSPCDQ